MITVDHVVFEYPNKRVLKDISFSIPQGSVTALVGPNGAGKTTLMRCICGLLPVYSGRILVNDTDVSQSPRDVHRILGYLSDFFGVYNKLTVRQCLNYNARIQNIDPLDMDSKIRLAAQRVGLEPHMDTLAGELSRGLRQRLGIAQAIIHEPKVLLLDEPASGLDPEARLQLSELITTLRDQGATIIVSSHIISELEDYCSDMLMIGDGHVTLHTHATSATTHAELLVKIQLNQPAEQHRAALESITQLTELRFDATVVHAKLIGDEGERQTILKQLVQLDVPVNEFSVHKKSLQDIYMDNRQ